MTKKQKNKAHYPWYIHANKNRIHQKQRRQYNYNILKNTNTSQTYEQKHTIECYINVWSRIKAEKLLIPTGGKTIFDNLKAMLIRDQILYCFANEGTLSLKSLWKEIGNLHKNKTFEDKEMIIKSSKVYKYLIKEANTNYWLYHENDSLDKIFQELYDNTKILDD